MKKIRKNIEGHFICEECGKILYNIRGFSTHIQFNHNKKNYYDKWIKEKGDD